MILLRKPRLFSANTAKLRAKPWRKPAYPEMGDYLLPQALYPSYIIGLVQNYLISRGLAMEIPALGLHWANDRW